MNIFKHYSNLMKKQTPIVIIYLSVLLILVDIVTNASQNKSLNGENSARVRILVYDQDEQNVLTCGLVQYLSQTCEIVAVNGKKENDREALRYRNVYSIITIPRGFGESYFTKKRIPLEVSEIPNTKESNYVNFLLRTYLDQIALYHELYPSYNMQQLVTMTNWMSETSVNVDGAKDLLAQEQNVSMNDYYNLLGYILFAMILLIVCFSMLSYHKRMNIRHLVAPISVYRMRFQLILGNLCYGYLYSILFLAVGFLFSKERTMTIPSFLYWGNTITFVTCVVMLAFYLSYYMKQKAFIIIVANILGLILAIISGIFIRQEYLPKKLLKLASITPMYWFVRGNDMIMAMEELELSKLLPFIESIGIQILFAVVLFVLIFINKSMEEITW